MMTANSTTDSQTCYVYLIQAGDSSFYKIGISLNVEKRCRDLQHWHEVPLRIIDHAALSSTEQALAVERRLHVYFRDYHVDGEWFDLEPRTLDDTLFLLGLISAAAGIDRRERMSMVARRALFSYGHGQEHDA